MKRILYISLICALIFTLPLSVYAIPSNDISGTYTLDPFIISSNSIEITYSNPITLSFGNIHTFYISGTSPLYADLTFSINVDIPEGYDLYIAKQYSSNSFGLNVYFSDGLSFTTVSDLSYSGTILVDDYYASYFDEDIIYNGRTNASYTITADFYKFTGPISSPIQFSLYSTTSNITNTNFPVACIISSSTGSGGSVSGPVGDFENGSISFQEAVDQILAEMQAVLNSAASTDFDKQIAIQLAMLKIEELKLASNEKYSGVVSDFNNSSSDIVDQFIQSGSTDVNPAISQLNSAYADALTQATSPEQGILINTLYNLTLSMLQSVFNANYKAELDNVVSDEQMTDKDNAYSDLSDLVNSEHQAVEIFEQSEYESYLLFSNWIAQFNTKGDATVYRSIFEFLFEDDKTWHFQPFLIIPFSLVLVGILLATTTVVFRGNRGKS